MYLEDILEECQMTKDRWLLRVNGRAQPVAPASESASASAAAASASPAPASSGPILDHVPCVSNQYVANETERALVQKLGKAAGCHTCLRYVESLTDFIVDHIPPKRLGKEKATYQFYPHCYQCASRQSSLVRQMMDDRFTKDLMAVASTDIARARTIAGLFLEEDDVYLLFGGPHAKPIPGQYGTPTPEQRDSINATGKCHSCGAVKPASSYHADHCPPVAVAMVSWLPAFVKSLAAKNDEKGTVAKRLAPLLKRKFFRPQCPACSHRQGSRIKEALVFAQTDFDANPPMTTRKQPVQNYQKVIRPDDRKRKDPG
jgi:hypothetical protein